VWIHYSGHGGRVPTLFPSLKLGNVDEALVPTDVGDGRARYLRDLELAYLLERLVESHLRVTVVLDCCHSGGAFRGHEGPESDRRRRGTDHVDGTPRPEGSLVASPAELRRNWRRVRKSYRRSLEPPAGWHFEPRGYVLIAACRAHEQAFEDVYGDGPSGALTHWLLDAARALPREVSYRQLFDRVRACLGGQNLGQTPQLEGTADDLVLASGRAIAVSGVAVLEIDEESGKVLLDVGQVHGGRIGTRWAVQGDCRPVACLELVEVGAVHSWAVVVGGKLDRIEPGAMAVPVAPAAKSALRIRTVRLRKDVSTAPGEIEKIRQAISGDGFLEALADEDQAGEPADFEVAATPSGFEIFDGRGRPVEGVEPVPFGKERAERFAAWNLVHLGRFHDVLELADDEASLLHGALELSLHRLPGRPAAGEVDPALLAALPDPPDLRAGDWVCLKLANRSCRVLNVTLLDLRHRDWRIVRIFPAQARFHSLEPDQEELLPFELERLERETIKAFATVDATGFDGLQLPAMGSPGFRQYRPLEFPGMDWTVGSLEIHAARNDA
jgi:hypothetical protein